MSSEHSVGIIEYSYKPAPPTEAEILMREAAEDPKLRQYMIAKGFGDPLNPAPTPTPEEITAAEQKEAAYLAAKGILRAQ